jgi:hypothetical protein
VAVNDPHKDSAHIVPEGTLVAGKPATVLYTDHNGILTLDKLKIDPASLPDHSNEALAIAAGHEAIKAATDSKGRVVTTQDSSLHQLAVEQGYKVEPLSKPVGDAAHVVKKPSSAATTSPSRRRRRFHAGDTVEQARQLTMTMVPQPADRDDTPVPTGAVGVHLTE